jgi:hypothetical protein
MKSGSFFDRRYGQTNFHSNPTKNAPKCIIFIFKIQKFFSAPHSPPRLDSRTFGARWDPPRKNPGYGPGFHTYFSPDKARCVCFRFPLHRRAVLQQWLHNVRREGFIPSATSFLCGSHFLPECFVRSQTSGRSYLKPNAVPTGRQFHVLQHVFRAPTMGFILIQLLQCISLLNLEIGSFLFWFQNHKMT